MKEEYNFLITGAHDFVAPYVYNELSSVSTPQTNIWMLGTGDLAGINVDLTHESPVLPRMMDSVVHIDGSDEGTFKPGTAIDEARNLTGALEAVGVPATLVYVSSVSVYGAENGEGVDESTMVSPVSLAGRAKYDVEKFLSEWCDRNGVALSVLRPAMVVGTGIGGYLRRLVNRIYRGTYRHVTDNESRLSVVHAVDVALAVRLVMGSAGVWNLTDGIHPSRHDLAEALAWRLDHKRIYSLSGSKARILARIGDYIPVTGFDSAYLESELSTLTYDSSGFERSFDFKPRSVVEYLRNHTYDESSL